MKVNLLNNINQTTEKKSNVPNFRGKSEWGKIGKDISKNNKFVPKVLTYLGQNDGEILNTVVTAGGTSVVAPIFIAGNPFSKEDKETKWYSAMRQPISAVIAFVFQMYINKKFNNWMAKCASTGNFGEAYDLRAIPKANYLKKIIKLEHPEFNSEQIRNEIIKRQAMAERQVVAKARQELKNKNIDFKDLISADTISEAKKDFVKELKIKYADELKGKKERDIDKFIDKKFAKEITPKMLEEKALKNITTSIENEAKAKFKIRELATRFTNIDEAIKHLQNLIKTQPDNKNLITNVIERLESIKIYEESKNLKAFSSIKDLGKTYQDVLHNVKVKRLVKAKATDALKAFGKLNKWAGIVVSLVTLPFSCGLLNWSYPRIMEKVMPKLQPYIHRNDPNWTPENAKKYGPPEKIEKKEEIKKTDIEIDDDEEDDDDE